MKKITIWILFVYNAIVCAPLSQLDYQLSIWDPLLFPQFSHICDSVILLSSNSEFPGGTRHSERYLVIGNTHVPSIRGFDGLYMARQVTDRVGFSLHNAEVNFDDYHNSIEARFRNQKKYTSGMTGVAWVEIPAGGSSDVYGFSLLVRYLRDREKERISDEDIALQYRAQKIDSARVKFVTYLPLRNLQHIRIRAEFCLTNRKISLLSYPESLYRRRLLYRYAEVQAGYVREIGRLRHATIDVSAGIALGKNRFECSKSTNPSDDAIDTVKAFFEMTAARKYGFHAFTFRFGGSVCAQGGFLLPYDNACSFLDIASRISRHNTSQTCVLSAPSLCSFSFSESFSAHLFWKPKITGSRASTRIGMEKSFTNVRLNLENHGIGLCYNYKKKLSFSVFPSLSGRIDLSVGEFIWLF